MFIRSVTGGSCVDDCSHSTMNPAGIGDPLVRAIAAGDSEAERSFIERYGRGVRALVVRACRPGDPVVDDLVQEVLLTVLGRLRQGALKDPNALPAYLQATIAHATRAEYRRRGLRGEVVESACLEALPAPGPGPAEQLHQQHLQRALAELMKALPVPRDRAVLRGFYLEQRERDELCAELGIDEPHFRRVLHRARERLRGLIESSAFGLVD
ncbi:RNA polymerase sigma factor [Aquimonas voraii]|uniref:RNA polymerase sigma-70 factor, ECF subfamily n=1 Tax=Aquimonas voraii TaxID=265719 RepID=A0A1G6ZYW8_9GAMM|nr:sigma-70 family RNA polymerase sigma factor [Aquimonas voraii]SDE07720.1 RNA polymerase sigma-70 factor, ECF subfamily [Aquimonas voraii]